MKIEQSPLNILVNPCWSCNGAFYLPFC